MKKLFIFGDVHSFYEEWIEALNKTGFDKDNKDHILVSLGDICDRGFGSVECLKLINSIDSDRKICVIGNHELMMEEMINRGSATTSDYHNRTVKTVEQLTDIKGHIETALIEMRDNKLWNDYKKEWCFYSEVGNHIFVHGLIPCEVDNIFRPNKYEYMEDWRNASIEKFKDATWLNGMEAWHKGVKEEGKTIYMGHWHTSFGHCYYHEYGVEFVRSKYVSELFAEYGPFIDEGIVALDACTVISRFVNVYVIEVEDKEWEERITN